MPEVNGVVIDLHTTQIRGGKADMVHLVPAGTFHGTDGRGPFHLADPEGVIAKSITGPQKRPLPIDYNHEIVLRSATGGAAPAAGWITQLQSRNDGLWGRVEWTGPGGQAVRAKEYRFISPAFATDADGNVMKLIGAALTNMPNLSELTALHTKAPDPSASTVRGMLGLPADADEMTAANMVRGAMGALPAFLASLREALGLSGSEDQAAILEAVRSLATSTHTPDPARFVPIQLFQQAVNEAARSNSGLHLAAAEVVVDRAVEAGHIMPFMRQWALNLCTVNKAAFDDFVAGAGKGVNKFIGTLTTPVDGGWARGVKPSGQMHPNAEVYSRMGLTVEEVEKYGDR